MAKDRCQNPRVDRALDYVLRHKDGKGYVCLKTPVQNSLDFAQALRLAGQWLNDTVWSWCLFYEAIEYNKARAEHAKWKGIKHDNVQSGVCVERNQVRQKAVGHKRGSQPVHKQRAVRKRSPDGKAGRDRVRRARNH